MKRIIAFLLMLALAMTTMSVYDYGLLTIATLPVAVGCLLVFGLCQFVDKHNRIGTVVMTGYLLALAAVMGNLARLGYNECSMYFHQWALTKGDEAEGSTVIYLVLMAIAAISFFGITVYYFVLIRYRVSMLTLVSLMPCVLYAKVIAEVDNYYLVIIVLLNIMAAIYHKRDNQDNKPAVVSAIVFTLVLTLISSVIPRKNDAIYYDRFEELFLQNGRKDEAGEAELSGLNDFSGNADGFQMATSRRLFALQGMEAPYLKRQNFDLYDFDKDYWYKNKEFEAMGSAELLPDVALDYSSYGELAGAMVKAEELSPGFLARYGLEDFAGKDIHIEDPIETLHVYPRDFRAEYYLRSARSVAMVNRGNPANWYTLYFNRDFEAGSDFIDLGGGTLSLEESEGFLEELYTVLKRGDINDNGLRGLIRTTETYINMTKGAIEYKKACQSNNEKIPESVKALADELTHDCLYEWEKAYVIQNYFYENGFTYDLTYKAPSDSVEYFLFEGKTGTCSDFASAYALLARAAGLSVRYAEGFVPTASSREGFYYIKETGSHAYPEVFFPLMGWMVLEPTIGGSGLGGIDFFDNLGIDISMDFSLISTIAYFMMAAGILGIFINLIIPGIAEIIFLIELLLTPVNRRSLKRYLHLVKKLSSKYGRRVYALTPQEVAELYREKSKNKKNIDSLIKQLERDIYMT